MIWLKSINLYAVAALVILGGVIVAGIFHAGVKHERNKNAAENAETNTVIVGDRGKDEAEIQAQDAAAAKIDAAVKKELELKANQRFILDEDTARLLNSVGGK